MKKKSLLVILLSCVFLGGCTYTRSLPLHCSLSKPVKAVYQVKGNFKILVKVADKRKIDNPNAFISDTKTEKTIYITDEPIADAVKRTIESGLQQMNFKTIKTDSSRYVFNCKIQSIETEDVAESFFHYYFMVRINTNCYLIDKKEQKVIWQDVITSEGRVNNSSTSDTDTRNAFCLALTNLIKEIQNSETLQMAINP